MRRSQNVLSVVLGVVIMAGCLGPANVEPILVVPDTAYSQPLEIESAKGLIERAAQLLKWETELEAPGRLIASRSKGNGKHVAQVTVNFDEDSFSISYRNSVQLDYDGAQIHKLYNWWVADLRDAILAETSAAAG